MNQWRVDNGSKKKLRGIKRRYKTLVNEITALTKIVPNPDDSGLGYWHLHLPFHQGYIDSKKTPNTLRRDIMQLLIDRVAYMKSIKTKEQGQYRVYSVISLPHLFDSQIVVLPDDSWFDDFFERDTEEQKWIPLDEQRNIVEEWGLNSSPKLEVRGYQEIIVDDDYIHKGEIWFIGELH